MNFCTVWLLAFLCPDCSGITNIVIKWTLAIIETDIHVHLLKLFSDDFNI